jgi:Subtilase family/Fibronectin type-III domain/PA domain/Peptidase inhibitor I9
MSRIPRRGIALAAAALLSAILASVAFAGSTAEIEAVEGQVDTAKAVPGAYVVQLTEPPVATYDGGIAGIPATAPADGEKVDAASPATVEYVNHLDNRHDAVLERVGGGEKLYDYRYAYNGFAAELSPAQVEKLETLSSVLSVEPVQEWEPQTADTPRFLGLTDRKGLWEQLGGPSSRRGGDDDDDDDDDGRNGAGEGIVVGVIDTGIWPEHPSVSDRVGKKVVYNKIKGWKGICQTTGDSSWNASHCNRKLIGARFFIEGFDEFSPVPLAPNDFRSPRDSDGHGTHTSTTAAGNHGVQPTGAAAGFGKVSGMAPRARIAAYKTCWDDGNPATGGCFTNDTAAAIDQAVADGVDVINFSISGTTSSFLNVVEQAAFNAAAAGVFVAMSAGNTPGASTVAHPSPWLTTVAASTHDRVALGRVTLGDGQTFDGVSQVTATVNAPVIRAQNAGLPGALPARVAQCFSQFEPNSAGQPVLDPALVAGKIVVCDRGGPLPNNARVDKSRAVQAAGGVGMILVNTANNSLNADLHFLPTVHLPHTNYAAIEAYAGTAGATATLSPVPNPTVVAPQIAAFSSAGPSAATFDQLKPDVSAPGVDVLAGYSPASLVQPGFLFNMVSGTSMSSPHIAGIGALLMDKHPKWSPAMIKSALMTSANDLQGTFAATTGTPGTAVASAEANRAFAQGAGHVRPNNAADPGLVYDNGPTDWTRFICGTGQLPASACASIGGPLDPSDLNLASITIGDMAGSQTVTRTVRSVGKKTEKYTVSFSGLPGINTPTVAPFEIKSNRTKTLSLTFTRASGATAAPFNTYQSGFMTLTGNKGHVVRSPVTIRPVAFSAPAEVLSTGAAVTWQVKPGYDGTLNATARGPQAAVETAFTVLQDPNSSFNLNDPQNVRKTFSLPPNSTLRVALFDDEMVTPNTDLDLYITQGNTTIASSGGATSNEMVTVTNTSTTNTATVVAHIHGFATGPNPPGSATGTLFDWLVTPLSASNMTLTGVGPAVTGVVQTHTASFAGLTPGTRYLGRVDYDNGSAIVGRTLVTVNP